MAQPQDPLAHFRRGNVQFGLDHVTNACRCYHAALQRCPPGDPLRVKVHINLGIALESGNRFADAAREYAKAAAADPRHQRIHKLLGSARMAAEDFDGAIEALTTALE